MLQTAVGEPRRKSSRKESRCRDELEVSGEHKGKDGKDKKGEKDKARYSSNPVKHDGSSKVASLWSYHRPLKPHLFSPNAIE